jgi:hypothetical protein
VAGWSRRRISPDAVGTIGEAAGDRAIATTIPVGARGLRHAAEAIERPVQVTTILLRNAGGEHREAKSRVTRRPPAPVTIPILPNAVVPGPIATTTLPRAKGAAIANGAGLPRIAPRPPSTNRWGTSS